MRSTILSLALACLLIGDAVGAQAIRLDGGAACQERRPDVTALPDGGFVAVWEQGDPEGIALPQVYVRRFAQDGTPSAPEFLVATASPGRSPQVAANAEGRFMVVWLNGLNQLRYRIFGPTGTAVGPARSLPTDPGVNAFALTATHDGGFAIVTTNERLASLWRLTSEGPPVASRTLDLPASSHPPFVDPAVAPHGPSGVLAAWAFDSADKRERTLVFSYVPSYPPYLPQEPLMKVVEPLGPDGSPRPRPAVAVNAAGQFLAAWNRPGGPGAAAALRAQVFTADRQPAGPPLDFGGWEVDSVSAPEALATGGGDFVLAWQGVTSGPALTRGAVARIGPDGALLAPVLEAWNTWGFESPALTLGAGGEALVAWQTGDLLPGDEAATCFSGGLYAREIPLSPETLFLRDGRFEARVRWTAHTGSAGDTGDTGAGTAGQLTPDSGSFWFFGRENPELLVKVLDGRAVNGSYWVFYASLTDVAFTLEVKDRVTGQTRTYENPAGRLASRADTAAFLAPPVAASAPAAPAAANAANAAGLASTAARSDFPGTGGPEPTEGPCVPPEQQRYSRRPGLCVDGRFEVEVAWKAGDDTGAGQGVGLTHDSGYLWFFDRNNIELVVKVLDGRAVNGHFWVFYGALTDVEYTVLVRDTTTGQVREYQNPAGQLRSRADTAAF